MGSINSRPKAPPVSTIKPIAAIAPVSVTTASELESNEQDLASESRQESLLRRSRGRLGTILTGFRGFLNSSNTDAETRKTLLGE